MTVTRRGSITSYNCTGDRTVNRHNRALSDTSLEFYHRRDLTPHSLVQSGQSRNTPGLSIDSRSVNVVEKDIVLDQKALMRSLAHRIRYRGPNGKKDMSTLVQKRVCPDVTHMQRFSLRFSGSSKDIC